MLGLKTESKEIRSFADFPGYSAAAAKLVELQDEHSALLRIHSRHSSLMGDQGRQDARIRMLAAAKLRGTAAPLSSDDAILARDFNVDGEALAVLGEAIRQQQATVAALQRPAAIAILQSHLAEHKRHAKAIGDALTDLRVALVAERHFVDELGRLTESANPIGNPLVYCAFGIGSCTGAEFIERIDNWFAEMRKSKYI